MRCLLLLPVFLLLLGAGSAMACGPDSDCVIENRHYRISLPEGYDGTRPVGAILFAHGYRGTAMGTMRNKALRRMASELGVALVALKSAGEDWIIPNSPHHTDADGSVEFSYVDAVLKDITRRFAIDDRRIVAAGFSAGGMMVWNLACAMPERFAGFVAMSGTFWRAPPENCQPAVTSMVHIHGRSDPVVPIAGRVIADTVQGDVRTAVETYAASGGFSAARAQDTERLQCAIRDNTDGDVLQFCTFDGGHSFRADFLRYGWETLERAGKL